MPRRITIPVIAFLSGASVAQAAGLSESGPLASVRANPIAFSDYGAGPYGGPVVIPDFQRASRRYADFEAAIRDGMREGPNFGGRLRVIRLSCGTGCPVVLVGDVAKGTVGELQIGGQDIRALDLTYRPDSSLLKAAWQDGDRCVKANFLWIEDRFISLDKQAIGPFARCW